MIRTILLVALAFSIINTHAQDTSINFVTMKWDDAVALATKENKPIFVDAYTVWCGPCKWLAANVFTDPEVAAYYNKTFVNVKLDMEKGEGIELAKKWSIQAYPTLIFFNEKGEEAHRVLGAMPAPTFIEIGKVASDKQYNNLGMKERFDKGDRDVEFLRNYATQLAQAYLPAEEVFEAYFKTQSEEQYYAKENLSLIQFIATDVNNKYFKHVEANRKRFVDEAGEDFVRSILLNTYQSYLARANAKGTDAFNLAKEDLKTRNNPESRMAIENLEMNLYLKDQDWKAYGKALDKKVATQKVDASTAYEYNDIAWRIFQNVSDKKINKKALAIAKKASESTLEPNIMDTYANLLYKTGKKAKAVEVMTDAVAIARKLGHESVQDFEQTLNKFKEGK